MNEKKAKRIRKAIYGEKSYRIERQYIKVYGTIYNDPESLRAIYQNAKIASK